MSSVPVLSHKLFIRSDIRMILEYSHGNEYDDSWKPFFSHERGYSADSMPLISILHRGQDQQIVGILSTGSVVMYHSPELSLRMTLRIAMAVLQLLIVHSSVVVAQELPSMLFFEKCDDDAFGERGWYDNTSVTVTSSEHLPGSAGALEFHFPKAARTPSSGGAIRRLFDPTPTVYLSYWVKYSDNWEGSNKPYHPHEFHFITDVDSRWIGPAATQLTTYIEHNEGRPLLAIQDALNIDETNIGIDLANVTELRAVAGCNGSSDRYQAGDCYRAGTVYRNGKMWKSGSVVFSDTPGSLYKNTWRFVEALFTLNSIIDGKGVADGLLRMWVDGQVVVDAPDVALRTGQHPTMRFNQFLIAPYIGDGSPVEQSMWVDHILVANGRMAMLESPALTSPPHGTSLSGPDVEARWTPVAGAMEYTLERATDSLFFDILVRSSGLRDTMSLISGIADDERVWWRVRAENPAGHGEWSIPAVFETRNPTDLQTALPKTPIRVNTVPHPVHGACVVHLTLPKAGSVRLLLVDALGRPLRLIADGWMSAGRSVLPFDTASLPAGMYYLRVLYNGSMYTRGILRLH